GAIWNTGRLTVSSSYFSGNSCQNINGAFNTLVPGQGGGIYNEGTLTVTTSTFMLNWAYFGGGIASRAGKVTVNNSTLNANTGQDTPPPRPGYPAGGGGIYNGQYSSLTVSNSTVDDNTGGEGGGIDNWGAATLTQTTVADNWATWGGG